MGDFSDEWLWSPLTATTKPTPTVCEQCGSTEGVQYEDSRTAYPEAELTRFHVILGEFPESPNRDIAYCRECAKLHHEYWDACWAEYNSSRY